MFFDISLQFRDKNKQTNIFTKGSARKNIVWVKNLS